MDTETQNTHMMPRPQPTYNTHTAGLTSRTHIVVDTQTLMHIVTQSQTIKHTRIVPDTQIQSTHAHTHTHITALPQTTKLAHIVGDTL